jgi:hypothetical protein
VDRAVPIWGKPEDGNASDKPLNTTLLSEIAQLLARHGVAPGAYIYIGLNPTSLLPGAISRDEPIRLKGNEQFSFA